MAVPFAQALQTLESMFGGVDRLVIEEVLEANGGNMDNTVDQLLVIAGDIPSDDNPTTTAAPTADRTPTTPTVTQEVKQYRNPLAADFLVLPASYLADHTTSSTSAAQMREDEMLAQLLENEEFLEELRQHPEFVDYMPGHQQQQQHQQATGFGFAPQYQHQQRHQYQQQHQYQQHAPNAIRPMNGNNQVGSYRAPSTTGTPFGQGNPNFEQQRADANPDDNMGAKIMLGWNKMGAAAKSKFNALATRFKGTGSSGNYSNVPTHEPLLGSDDERDGGDDDDRRLGMTGRRKSNRLLSLHRPRDGMLEPMEQLLPSNEEYPPSPNDARDGQVIDSRRREGVDGFQDGLGDDYASLNDGSNELKKV